MKAKIIVVLLLLAAAAICLHMVRPKNLGVEQDTECRNYVVERLTHPNGAHFSKELAEKIYECNRVKLHSDWQWNRESLDHILAKFAYLKNTPENQEMLMRHPELGSLMIFLPASDDNQEEDVIKTFLASIPQDEADYQIIANLYGAYPKPEEARDLAEILCYEKNEEYILRLIREKTVDDSVLYCRELWKLSKEDPRAAAVFQKWLYERFDEILQMSDDDTDDHLQATTVLEVHTDKIVELLKRHDFRDRFLDEFWPVYKEKLHNTPEELDGPLGYYCMNPEVWDAMLDDLDLFKRSSEIYKPIIIKNAPIFQNTSSQDGYDNWKTMIIQGDSQMITQLFSLSEDHLRKFAPLFDRNLSKWIYAQMIDQLTYASDPNATYTVDDQLNYWTRISNTAIRHEFAPDQFSFLELLPGYDIGVVFLKIIEGRRVTTLNIVMAVVDGAFITLDIVTIATAAGVGTAVSAGARRVVSSVSKTVIKNEAKVIAKTLTKKATQETIRKAIAKSSKRLTQKLMEKAAKELTSEGFKQLEKEVGQLLEKQLAKQVAKQMKQGGKLLGKTVQQKITTNLMDAATEKAAKEAAENTGWNKFLAFFKKNPGGIVIKTVSEDVSSNALGYAVLSAEPTQDAINYVIREAGKMKANDLWRANMSAWWLLNGSNAL